MAIVTQFRWSDGGWGRHWNWTKPGAVDKVVAYYARLYPGAVVDGAVLYRFTDQLQEHLQIVVQDDADLSDPPWPWLAHCFPTAQTAFGEQFILPI